MAEASASSSSRWPPRKAPRIDSSPSDDERKISETSSRRHTHYGGQRTSRSSRPSTTDSRRTSASQGKRASYQQRKDYSNLGQEAMPPPINPDDWKTQNPPSFQEASTSRSQRASLGGSPYDRMGSMRRRRSANDGGQVPLGAAISPPVPPSHDREAGLGAQQHDGDPDREDDSSSEHSRPYQQRQPQDLLPSKGGPSQPSRFLTELHTIAYLIFFAIIGTLARLGTQWIVFYPGTPIVTPVIWPNFGGSFVLGFLSEDQSMFRESSSSQTNGGGMKMGTGQPTTRPDLKSQSNAEATKRKKAIPLYIGLAVGFCGSFTSFSSFVRDVFLALSNNLPTPIDHPHTGTAPSVSSAVSRNGGYSFEAILQLVIVTIALSLGAFVAGGHIAVFAGDITPRIHGSFVRNFIDPLMVFLGFGCWLGAVLLSIWPPENTWRGEVVFALVFAPLGCLLRYYASLKLNSLVPSFPLGTFAINMLGTAVEGMCFDIQHVRVGVMGRIGGGVVGCQILQGVQDGFCGCLTTVSTWVAEINGLRRKHGWPYAFASVLGGLCLMVIIMGSVRWSVGFSEPVCDTGYTAKVRG